jgi:hypothetical protein
MRSYTPAELTYLQSRNGHMMRGLLYVRPRDRATGLRVDMCFWTGEEDRTFTVNGVARTFVGGGAMKSIDPIVMQTGLVVRMQRVILAPLFAEVAQFLRGHDAFRAPAELYRAFFDPQSGNLIDNPRRVWKGLVGKAPMPTPAIGGESTVELTLSSAAEALTQGLTLTRSDAVQSQRGGDRFYRYKGVQATAAWGELRAIGPAPSSPSTIFNPASLSQIGALKK